MKRISILNQQDSKLLFSVEDYGVYFLMPLEDLGRLSELSYEWFEEYLPNSCCSPYPIRLLADGSVRDWEDALFSDTHSDTSIKLEGRPTGAALLTIVCWNQ